MTIQELIKLIEQWAIDRQLDKKATVIGQIQKTAEEGAELLIGISKNNQELLKDSIGDVFVTLVIGNMINHNHDILSLYDGAKVMAGKLDIKDNKMYYMSNISGQIWNLFLLGTYSESFIYGTLKVLVLTARYYGYSLEDCVEMTYKEIADRKGRVIDGTFVKESDLNE